MPHLFGKTRRPRRTLPPLIELHHLSSNPDLNPHPHEVRIGHKMVAIKPEIDINRFNEDEIIAEFKI